MATAFQPSGFQADAFQIEAISPGAFQCGAFQRSAFQMPSACWDGVEEEERPVGGRPQREARRELESDWVVLEMAEMYLMWRARNG